MKELEEIRSIKESVENELLKRPGVTGVEIGYKIVKGKKTDELAIRVHVRKKSDVPRDQMIPTNIDGVKTDVLERDWVASADTQRYDTLKGGISISQCQVNNDAGTLGVLVTDSTTNEPLALSCWHGTCRYYW